MINKSNNLIAQTKVFNKSNNLIAQTKVFNQLNMHLLYLHKITNRSNIKMKSINNITSQTIQ